ncbi:MAG: hypothetical protein KH501_12145, partial [Eubacterium limosum]|nr:hypothetical protein [Eubacterium limosum]
HLSALFFDERHKLFHLTTPSKKIYTKKNSRAENSPTVLQVSVQLILSGDTGPSIQLSLP